MSGLRTSARDGEDDPRWFGRVLGQIPDTSVNNVFSQRLIDQMKAKQDLLALHSANAGVSVDPAGEGVDKNVLMAGKGGEVLKIEEYGNMAPSVGAIKAVELCKNVNGYWIIVDCDGMGIGWWQELDKLPMEYLQGIQIIKFHGSSKETEFEIISDINGKQVKKRIYENLRAEAAFVTKRRGEEGKAGRSPGKGDA